MYFAAVFNKLVSVFSESVTISFLRTLKAAMTLKKVIGSSREIAVDATGDNYLGLIGRIDRPFISIAVAPYLPGTADKLLGAYRLIVGASRATVPGEVAAWRLQIIFPAYRTKYLYRHILLHIVHAVVAVFVTMNLTSLADKVLGVATD